MLHKVAINKYLSKVVIKEIECINIFSSYVIKQFFILHIKSKVTINFTYAASGCMSDSEYSSGSASVDGKGLVATITNGGAKLVLSYYDENGNAVGQAVTVNYNAAPDSGEEPDTIIGDADGDEEVTTNDASIMMKAMVSSEGVGDLDVETCDIDGDGEVTINDVTCLLKLLVGLPIN